MFTIEHSTTINRPANEVFAYVANPNNIPKWRTGTREVRSVQGNGEVGTTYELLEQVMGTKTYGQRVTQYEPDRLVKVETTSGPMFRPVQTYTFEEAPGGATKYTVRLEVATSGIMSVLGGLMKGQIRKATAGYAENLKRNLEGGGQGDPAGAGGAPA